MAMGTSVFRIRIELIFRRCWNLVTLSGQPILAAIDVTAAQRDGCSLA
jgi:hypothetical protein